VFDRNKKIAASNPLCPGWPTTFFVYHNKIVLHSDLREPDSEHTNEDDSTAYDFCNKISKEGNILAVFVGGEEMPSQEIFKALNPIDLSSAQIELPLHNIHTNEVVNVLFVCFSKAYRRLLILLISIYGKKKIFINNEILNLYALNKVY